MEKRVLEVLKGAPYFTKQNIGLALQKDGEDLNYWIKKLRAQKMLITLKKGMYISSYYQDMISQNPSDKELYLMYLANVLRSPSYVSLEFILSRYNIIPEASFAVTSITTKSSRVFSSAFSSFIYRSIKEELFFGYENQSFKDKTIRVASKGKALFDFLYLKNFKTTGIMKRYLLEEGRINWDIFEEKDTIDFMRAVASASSKKMQLITEQLKKEHLL